MKNLIKEKLEKLEKEKNIKILYVCESGSRGWGFASPNSDWDVRFIYVHAQDWYLSINEKKDMMDFGVDENELDLTGWELRKFLRLMSGSNASPFEWLQSPIVYSNPGQFRERIWALAPAYFKPRSTAFHYLGLAKSSLKKGLVDGEMDIKKYFYVLRPLLAAFWICDKQTIPPMEFEPLLHQIKHKTAVYEAIQDLTARKMKAQEGDWTQPVPIIQDFIEEEMNNCGRIAKDLPAEQGEVDTLDEIFRQILRESC